MSEGRIEFVLVHAWFTCKQCRVSKKFMAKAKVAAGIIQEPATVIAEQICSDCLNAEVHAHNERVFANRRAKRHKLKVAK